ncbi:echinoderm microtubule-associated protein-like 2 isoform X3 [Bemisia tabaci]|uniref:echinoderm microtubule-associated protein-like 2 isoform X3 n=1 Tax=Bemisia tabaci TaxID=7038 RepID=UPI003B28B14B
MVNSQDDVSTASNGAPDSLSVVSKAWNDMIDNENETLRERVAELEKKVLDYGDEVVCLRSTLADVLRRLNQLESLRSYNQNVGIKNGGVVRSQSAQAANNFNSLHKEAVRYRPVVDANNRDPVRRVLSYTPSTLPQRRAVHYQSTGSLHSDSPSSSSVSPVPTSPSPSTTPTSILKSPSTNTNLHTAKRWSSTGDFNNVPANVNTAPPSRLATKSMYNLHTRSQSFQNHHSSVPKLGMRDASYNEDDGSLRMYIRGRPVVLLAPSDVAENYNISKVAPPPQSKLKLDWVYGYRGKDCRSNLFLLPTGEIVYFVAAVAILYNVEEQSQRHYLGHTDDIKCLTIHPNKMLIATGQTAGHDAREGRPHVRIWNSVSLVTVSVIGIGEFDRSICCLSFSKSDGGTLLCAVDEANDHNISVWEWQRGDKGHKVTETKCSVDTVIACEFHPIDRNVIVTCGKSHINFWTLDAGGTLYKRQGIFEGNRDRPKYVTCLAFTQTGETLSGDSNGNVVVWQRGSNTIAKIVRNVHEGSIFTICVSKEGSIITGGGKDGRLFQFDSNLQPTGYEARIAEHLGGIRTVSEGRGSQLLVGSTRNCILIGSLSTGFSPAVLGHTDELWALCAHPTTAQFLTAGFDKIVQLWDSLSHTVVWSKDIAEQAQSACFSPDGSILIIGCVSGRWIVMDSETREPYFVHNDGVEPIQVIKFSPDGKCLALGSRDNFVYVFQVSGDYRKYSRVGRCAGHSSFITHLDWSGDSQYIRSNSGDYEILFWNASTCRQIPQTSQMRDVVWASNSCVLSFPTIGIWPDDADGTDVNACERSHSARLLATADDFGKVKLYAYPCSQPKSLCHTYSAHSSHVTNVAFLHDDTRLISTGGKDMSVMQWQVV